MIQKKIIDYVTQTPYNVNPQVLKTLLETETSPNTGIVSIPIRGPLKNGDKIFDYVPMKDAELVVWMSAPNDDGSDGIEGIQCELVEMESEEGSALFIKINDVPTFAIVPMNIPGVNLTRGIYFIAEQNISFNDSFFGILTLMDVKKVAGA